MKKILSRGISLLSFLFMVAFISIIGVKADDVNEVNVHITNQDSVYVTIYDSSGSEVTYFYGDETTISLKIGEKYRAAYYSSCSSQESYFTPSLEDTEWDTGFYYDDYCISSPSFADYYLNISKVWKDNNDAMHKRPESIRVEVDCGSYYNSEVTLSKNNNWEASVHIGYFDYYYNITCSITELDDLEYYERIDGNETVYVEGYSYSYVDLVNEYVGPTIENTEIEIQKIWEDENNKKDIRPESVTFLLKDSVIQEIELNDENEWKVVISVPKTDEEGNDIEYTIDEKEVPDGYEKKIDGFTITNKLIEEPLEEEKEPEEPVNPPANPNTGDSISKGSILFIGSLGILSYLLNRKKLSLK